MTPQPALRGRARRGLTLIEIIIAMTIFAFIGGLLLSVMLRQQRYQRALADVADSRGRMRDIATIIPTDLRGTSSVGGDLLTIGLTALQFRAAIGSSALCRYAAPTVIDLPPKVLSSGNVITSWINPPAPGDVVFIYNDGTAAGNVDDTWTQFTITDTTSAVDATWCPAGGATSITQVADDAQRKYRVTLSAAPDPLRIKPGAPIRFAREVRYSLYAASDANWYVGYETCTPSGTPGVAGPCADREVLAGPVRAASTDTTTSGLYFVYYAQDGTPITNPALAAQIARVGIGLRTSPLSLKDAMKLGGSMVGRDSLRLTVGIRNRI
jgi:prepilin-type N-terminal cleavage/methylation domain-containing protein